jgi:hypothetical protein
MDKPTKIFPGIGEVGIDTEASPGNGIWYVKLYDGSLDSLGFDSEEDAIKELEFVTTEESV